MSAVENLVAQARTGHFADLLPDLLATAEQSGGDRDEAWLAAAAAIEILFWHDRFTDAADLAQRLIAQDGPLGGELCDQSVPFLSAFLAAETHAHAPAAPRMQEAAAAIPAGRNLREEFEWLAENLPGRSAPEFLPGWFDWNGPTRPLQGPGADLAQDEFAALTAEDQHLVWQALTKANDFDRARILFEAGGHTPDRYHSCLWLAGCYAVRGDIPHGEQLLLAAHSRWWPYATWDALATEPVVQPVLRLVLTDQVREHYLSRPIGPEAEKTS